jgi:hypothetical protein
MKAKKKLRFVDGEMEPPFGASNKEIGLYQRLRDQANRIVDLEAAIAAHARGHADTSVFQTSPQVMDMLGLLTRSGLYGDSVMGTVEMFVREALRQPGVREDAFSQKWKEAPPRNLRRRARRPRRRPGKR